MSWSLLGLNSYTGHHKNVLEQVPCARAIKPKCSHCTLSHFLNHWEGAKDITGLFYHVKKNIVCHCEPPSWEIQGFFGFWFDVSIRWFHLLLKGGLQLHIHVFKIVEVNQSEVVFSGRCCIDWRLSLYTESYLVTVAIVCCSDDFSWQSPSWNSLEIL